jgi:hypothetical protein
MNIVPIASDFPYKVAYRTDPGSFEKKKEQAGAGAATWLRLSVVQRIDRSSMPDVRGFLE